MITFIIISGFVITHLLVERPEPYRYYLLWRFMRIFPLFAVTCVAGYFAYKFQVPMFDYGFDPEFADLLRKVVVNTDQHFWSHLIAHVTMLHGALSYNLLPYTDTAFNIPAWSISLEWQFYIVAPFIVAVLVKRPILTPLLAVLIVVSQLLFKWGWFGSYNQPATLLGMAEYFAVGVASRLFYPALVGKIKNQYAVLAAIIVLYGLTRQGSLAVWSVVYLGLLTTPPSVYNFALESRLASYFGTVSYSIYLSHFIIIIGCEWLWIICSQRHQVFCRCWQ